MKLLFLLALLTGGAQAFVYSCEEIYYKLVNTDFEQSTRFVCLAPNIYDAHGCGWTSDFNKIYVQADNVSTSFCDLINSPSHCVERPANGPWKIIADLPLRSFCTGGMSLIFTSTPPKLNVISLDYDNPILTATLSNGDEQLFANSEHAMNLRVRQCNGNGNITCFTGAGNGEAEHRFLLKSWRCVDLSEWIISFDDVITVAVDGDVQLTVDYSGNNFDFHDLTVSPDLRVTAMASGRSDNWLNLVGYNFARFVAGKPTALRATCAPCSFEEAYEGYVRLTEYDEDYSLISQELFRTEGTYDFTFQKSFQIEYKSNTCDPRDLWDRQDTFVVEMSFSDASNAPTSAPIVESDPYCGCALDATTRKPVGWNSTDIWLDVVIVLDTSEAMGEQALAKASSLVESFLHIGNDTILTTNKTAKYYTRVGVIAMADEPQILFELNMTKADTVLGKAQIKKGLANIDLGNAFIYALNMMQREEEPTRGPWNTRRVIYFMTDSETKYDLTKNSDITHFKETGTIIVNDFIKGNGDPNHSLKQLASDGYLYADIQDDTMASIQLLCKANCFCWKDKIAYVGPNSDAAAQATGGCFQAQVATLSYSKAKTGCANNGGGLIASVHDSTKAHFLQQLMFTAAPKTFYFWIGYSKSDDGKWRWEDKSANPYTNWDANEPSPVDVAKCAYLDTAEQEMYWGAGNCNVGFSSACEYAPCSVGHMC